MPRTIPHCNRAGMIARWRPVHSGQAAVLRGLCRTANSVLIGIGSSNRYNARNPFTTAETETMLRLALGGFDNFSILPVPDLDDGPRWREMVLDMFNPLDLFLTDNPYVAHLLGNDFHIERPVALVPPNERIPVTGTHVRLAMARGEPWQALVPNKVAEYIASNRLDDRLRREFGLEILALQTIVAE